MAEGHMRWTVWVEGHRDWGLLEVIVPRSISAELAGYILADGADMLRQVARAHGLEDATVAWGAKSYDAEGHEVREQYREERFT